jgi:hypothetical protein
VREVERPPPGAEQDRSRTIPYVWTAVAVLAFVAVSQLIPAARAHFPSNLPPLFLRWHPAAGPGVVVPLALAIAFVAAVPRLLGMRPAALLTILVVFAWIFAMALAVQAGRAKTFQREFLPGGVSTALTAVLERDSDYFADGPLIDELGPRTFAERFPEINRKHTTTLSVHSTTHPPGAPLFVWFLSKLTGGSVLGVAVLIALIGALGVLPTYAIARELAGERTARVAAVLFACSPGVLIFSATSLDIVFLTAAGVALAALVRAPRSDGWAVATGILTALATCLTWGALLVGLVGIGLGLISLGSVPIGTLVRRGLLAAAGLVATAIAVRILTGIDLVADFGPTRIRQEAYLTYDRSYGYWLIANIVAFLVAVGIAHAALLVAVTRDRWRERKFGMETVIWATLLILSSVGQFKGETDHNWLFLLPLVVAVCAEATDRVRGPAAGGFGQAVGTEVLFYTAW